VLGQGGFGVTYLAHDTNLDRRVAIKEYLPAMVAARHADDSVRPLAENKREDFAWGLDNFLVEARTLARFRHENIVGVHSVFEENSTAYMVMAYEQGDSLSSLYRRGEYRSQGELEDVFFPIFDGLGEIHRLGFVHRDIKPANIYIRQDGTAVLLDFGAARPMAQQQTGEMTSLVSQGYTPLEQYSVNYGEQGPWSDVYALAATMHEGITGRKPEEALSRSACLLRRRPDPVSGLSADAHPGFDARFLDAVSTGLALQPEERPQDLERWLAHFRGSPSGSSATRSDAFDVLDEPTRLRRPEPPPDVGRTRLRPPGPRPGSGAPEPSGPSGRAIAAAAPSAMPVFDRLPADRPAPPRRPGPGQPDERARHPRNGGRSGVGRTIGAPIAFVLLAAIGGAAWWFLDAAPDEAILASPDPALVDTLPSPREPLGVASRAAEVERRLDGMGRLAALYRQADDAGAMSETLELGARALREELGALALEWHPQRHAGLVGSIERVAALLPERIAERAGLQGIIGSANGRSELDAARSMLEANAIVTPADAALIDRIGRLGVDDYRALSSTSAWAGMMAALGNGALERVRAEDFDQASLLVRAALTLQPDEPFMRRLGEHLGRAGTGS